MIFKIYNIIWIILKPFVRIWLFFRIFLELEDKLRINERFGLSKIKKPKGNLIWIHASSIGESVSGISLVQGLKSIGFDGSILFTTFTLSAANYIKENDQIIHQFVPLDYLGWINNFLNHWNPVLSIMMESEIWPNIIISLDKRKIPIIMASAQLSNKSKNNWKKLGFQNSSIIFSKFDLVLAIDKKQSEIFKSLGSRNIKNLGSLKVAANLKKPNLKLSKKLKLITKNKLVILAASTHDGEEKIILNSVKKLIKKKIKFLLIIVPRHIYRGKEIIKKFNLNAKLRSQNQLPAKDDNVWVADTFGEMNLFYSIADIVIICGSFFLKGGHNPSEACHFKNSIIIGPNNFKNLETVSEMINNNAIIKLKDNKPKTLSKTIYSLSKNKDLQQQLSNSALNMINTWKSRKILGARLCLELLNKK